MVFGIFTSTTSTSSALIFKSTHVTHVIQQTCSIINSHLHLKFKKKKIKRLVLSPQLRAVVYLLFGLLAEKVAGVKWQIADPGHGNILLSSCGNIGPNFPTVVRSVVPKGILSRTLVECITTVIRWATSTSRAG